MGVTLGVIESLILLGFASHRLWLIWFQEIAKVPREYLIKQGGRIAYFASCQFCTSVWAGIIISSLWLFGGRIGQALIWMLATSACLSVVEVSLKLIDTIISTRHTQTQALVAEVQSNLQRHHSNGVTTPING